MITQTEELMELRAERMELLARLEACDNEERQIINKQLSGVIKRIQRLSGIGPISAEKV